ncbi:unnamed protein product [Spirodela intermedia]|uniref:Uncharacterized protein n=2 Tax=Spirodela intermedia TaxID=51605 RepID=A0A7I8J4P4_SPIIN|nr:unnamed protein product [Spirodela intermedia]CAA6665208.1 unnamed protein product [Spirodela intermedia]CAA7401938.1 unnamed protein product [Spirodela intermedia]
MQDRGRKEVETAAMEDSIPSSRGRSRGGCRGCCCRPSRGYRGERRGSRPFFPGGDRRERRRRRRRSRS